MARGIGMNVVLVNLESQKTYVTSSLAVMSPHSVAQNLPPGRYGVVEVQVPVGSVTFANWSEDLNRYFGPFRVDEGEVYFLGEFAGRQRVGFRDVMTLTKVDSLPSVELLAKFRAASTGWEAADFTPVGPAVGDTLLVY